MAFGMRLGGGDKHQVEKRVRQAAEMLQITPLLERLPKQLSGGQRQRVAIGRAITRDPKVFLFDEPLSNLDAGLRVATRIEINKLHERMPDTTMIYVTHDQVEAMTLADRIVVLNAGIVEQVGSPMELYLRPANLFVARFIGSPSMNTVPCRIEAGGDAAMVKPEIGRPVKVNAVIPEGARGKAATFGVRPEDLEMTRGEDAIFTGTIDIIEHLGEVTLLYVNCGKEEEPIVAKLDGMVDVRKGEKIGLTAPIGMLHVFDENGRAYTRKVS
jgi:ABC-type sugar transport system ATPase subunit